MSRRRSRNLNSHTIKNKTLITTTFSLIVLVSMCTLLSFPRALAATIVSDDFNDNSIDTNTWDPNNLFTGPTDTNVAIAETSQRLEIGPLLQNVNGPSCRGISTVNTYNSPILTLMLSWFKRPLPTLTPRQYSPPAVISTTSIGCTYRVAIL